MLRRTERPRLGGQQEFEGAALLLLHEFEEVAVGAIRLLGCERALHRASAERSRNSPTDPTSGLTFIVSGARTAPGRRTGSEFALVRAARFTAAAFEITTVRFLHGASRPSYAEDNATRPSRLCLGDFTHSARLKPE